MVNLFISQKENNAKLCIACLRLLDKRYTNETNSFLCSPPERVEFRMSWQLADMFVEAHLSSFTKSCTFLPVNEQKCAKRIVQIAKNRIEFGLFFNIRRVGCSCRQRSIRFQFFPFTHQKWIGNKSQCMFSPNITSTRVYNVFIHVVLLSFL